MMGVDFPDGTKLSVIQGVWGTEYKNLRVTEDGELYILVSALTGVTLIPLQADEDGNLFLNIKAQDLAAVMNRPTYGAAKRSYTVQDVAANSNATLHTISGKGVIYGGHIIAVSAVSKKDDYLKVTIDGEAFTGPSYYELKCFGQVSPTIDVVYLTYYDNDNFQYSIGYMAGITFESSISIVYYNQGAGLSGVSSILLYALV